MDDQWIYGSDPANLAALLVVVAGAVLGFRDWWMAGEVSDELDRAVGHDRFLGLLGLMLCAFFVLPIAAQAIAGRVKQHSHAQRPLASGNPATNDGHLR